MVSQVMCVVNRLTHERGGCVVGSVKYALKVIEGKLRGHSYPIPDNSELFLGRGTNFDIVIDEDMVSRKHARLLTFHDNITLQDLQSTNGTSVNQQRIQGIHRLQIGDQLTIGTCVLELTRPLSTPPYVQNDLSGAPNGSYAGGSMAGGSSSDSAAGSTYSGSVTPGLGGYQHTPNAQSNHMATIGGAQPNLAQGAARGGYQQPPQIAQPVSSPPRQGAQLQGAQMPGAGLGGGFNNMMSINGARPRAKLEVGHFPSSEVADLLTLLERLVERRHDGVLAAFDPEEREGSIYLRGGRVYFASYDDPHQALDLPMTPEQALVKICCWSQGRYKVKQVSALPAFEQELNEDSRSLLERVRRSCHEMAQLRSRLPPLNSALSVCQPLTPLLTSLSQDQLYLFQLGLNRYEIRSLIDCHPQGEREGIRALLHLIEHGYLQA